MLTNDIQNANSSGQGYSPSHVDSPFNAMIEAFGYVYSHSVPIGYPNGERVLHHCYKQGEHNISFHKKEIGPYYWTTSISCASGLHHKGMGTVSLEKHLWSKARRYAELRPTDKAHELRLALDYLDRLAELRERRSGIVSQAFAFYGEHGSLIAGIERDHFPTDIKNTLRKNAGDISEAINCALIHWKRAHKTIATFRKALQNVPQFQSRY